MKQLEFGLTRKNDPDTSRAAAESISVSVLEHEVCKALILRGPSTCEEIAACSGLALQSVTPRMRPLEVKRRVIRTQHRRPGASGRLRIVWQLVSSSR